MDGIEQIEASVCRLEEAKSTIVELVHMPTDAACENEANTGMTKNTVKNVTDVVNDLQNSANGLRDIAGDISENMQIFKL